ncbi:MAG TPA: SDR family oxidoreductase [Vicinamibacteria bacterium]|nr:SDR family oxidoreductase [Vicinamibacteria bacterium]
MSGPFSLEGRVALVTGAAGGLGAAYAVGLAEAGADVAVHDRNPVDGTCERIRGLGRRAAALSGDISAPEVPDRLVGEAISALGALDIVVNNAGTIRRAPAAETGDEDWLAVLDVNLSAVFRTCRAAGRHMLARGRGKIVNVASLLAFQGGILVPAYAASKGGVAQLTKALANEWAGRGVNVNAIAPGYVRTDNTAPLQADPVRSRAIVDRIPAGRWAEPSDIVGSVVFLCSPASDYVHGHVLVVDGGWMGR